jgi:hypothetical protein
MDGFDARHVMATRIAREWDEQRTTPDWLRATEPSPAESPVPSVVPFPGPAAPPLATAGPPPAA